MCREEEEMLVTIVDEREEKMVPHTGGAPTVRVARFLKHSINCKDDEVAQVPPLPKAKAYHHKKCPLVVHFKGWRCPQRKWKEWVDQLKPKYEALWKKSGIYDSIITSTYEFLKDKELVVGLAESWCPDTNTFAFAWGEVTVTLEDMLIIGGFSVLGEPVTSPLRGELLEIEKKLIEVYQELSRSRAHKADHYGWLKRFRGSNCDLEHAAFLSLWLSRYVFPTKPETTIGKKVFPIAIQLSQATRMALAPAVLASLYRDLRVLKEHLDLSSRTDSNSNDLSATLWAPFQIMQIWAWERFPSLQPTPNSLNSGEPRAARWDKLKSKSTNALVKVLNVHDDFQWRPYSLVLENWQHPSFYREQGEWVTMNPDMNEELLSFSRCLVPCELVGLDCIEQYVPHRVGMQFGMDQDIPGSLKRANAHWKIAWRTYDKPIRNISFYIPPRLFESDVTAKYFEWWNQSSSSEDDKIKSISVHPISSSSLCISSESECSVSPPIIACERSREDQSSSNEDKMTISEWRKRHLDHVPVNDREYRAASSSKYYSSAKVQSSSSIIEEKTNGEEQSIKLPDNNLQSIDPIISGNIFEEDKDVSCKDSDDACSETSPCRSDRYK